MATVEKCLISGEHALELFCNSIKFKNKKHRDKERGEVYPVIRKSFGGKVKRHRR